MSENEEHFTIGDVIEVVSMENETIKGAVENFDWNTGLMVLKNTSKIPKYGNFCVLDLNFAKSAILKSVNGNKLAKELDLCLLLPENDQKCGYTIRRGSSPRGVLLFKSLKRLIDDVSWRGANILVLHEVVVSPPYDTSCITGDGRCIPFVQRIIQNIVASEEKKPKYGNM
ncbi:protein LSM12 homolog A-like [Cimex lectularius]|uniref:AD domain-containing protein n=1 Tax=Cimex lectularius TaxID=79782 RepID=A0A8I6RRK5_CIMLE|nr:protein LSM12 homolog A-like [Cimex lectularius]